MTHALLLAATIFVSSGRNVVSIPVPVEITTRIVFPGPGVIKMSGVNNQEFGFEFESISAGIVRVQPKQSGLRAVMTYVRNDTTIEATLESIAGSAGATHAVGTIEIKVQADDTSQEAEILVPALGAEPDKGLDLEQMVTAKAKRIGRKDGLPGQKVCELEDILAGEKWVWLRLALVDGANEKVDSVSVGNKTVDTFQGIVAGKKLKIIVKVDAKEVSSNTNVRIQTSAGDYKFKVSAPTIPSLIRNMF